MICVICIGLLLFFNSFCTISSESPQWSLTRKNISLEKADQIVPVIFWRSNVSCEFKGNNTTIDISKIVPGKWFIGFRNWIEDSNSPFLEAYNVTYFDDSCTYIDISYDDWNKELLMQYKCRDRNSSNVTTYNKCNYYIKFTADKLIKNEVTHQDDGCYIDKQLKNVFISDTDYQNYITISSCITKKGPNNTLRHRYVYFILLRNDPDDLSIEQILRTLDSVTKRSHVRFILEFANKDKIPDGCSCLEDKMCHKKVRTFCILSWIKRGLVLFLLVMFGFCLFLKYYNSFNKVLPGV